MRSNHDYIKALASTADVLNTISGGISEPVIRAKKLPDAHQIRVKMPGTKLENLKVEVNNNQLSIFYPLEISSQGTVIPVPLIIVNRTIPYFINVEGISASIEEDVLLVQLPFNGKARGYQRKIVITKS